MSELLPCPFCGEQPEESYGEHSKEHWVACASETCQVCPSSPGGSVAMARAAWNQRAPLSLESVRSEARHDALEEAAKICDGVYTQMCVQEDADIAKRCAAAIRALSPARVAEGVPEGESRWLIERTYAKGQPAERREFWLGTAPNDMFHDSFDSNNEVWTINALEAVRFSSQKIAETLRYRHFHPEAPVEACEHLFQCGISPTREAVHSTELRK